MKYLKILIIAILLINQGCKQVSKETTNLGTIEFKVTSTPEAIQAFEKGVLLMHSFMYDDAALEFQNAQTIDPDFAMAYWGEALSYNHPLWNQQDYDKANEVLNRLAATAEGRLTKAPTDFEKDLFKGVEVLYGEGTKNERDDAYADYLGDLSKKYPQNHEISAFHALSLLGSVEAGRDYDVYGKGAKIVEGILRENPSHPGALHYLIHSYDDPDHASLALEAANSYAEVAPDAGHALHMPSHIYIALGMWDDVISSNIRSYDARLKRVEENTATGWNLHAYHWLLYGYLQTGDSVNVNEIMGRMQGYVESRENSNGAKSYMIGMVGNYLAETGNWEKEPPSLPFETKGLNIRLGVAKLFMDGYTSYLNQNTTKLEEVLASIEAKISSADDKLITSKVAVCDFSGFASRSPTQNDVNIAKVMATQLKVLLAQLNGESDEDVEELMAKAVELQSSIYFSFGPPEIIIPTYEMYGNWLVEKERYADAMIQFDKSLEKGPGRRNALLGKLSAAEGLDDQSVVEEIQNLINSSS